MSITLQINYKNISQNDKSHNINSRYLVKMPNLNQRKTAPLLQRAAFHKEVEYMKNWRLHGLNRHCQQFADTKPPLTKSCMNQNRSTMQVSWTRNRRPWKVSWHIIEVQCKWHHKVPEHLLCCMRWTSYKSQKEWASAASVNVSQKNERQRELKKRELKN